MTEIHVGNPERSQSPLEGFAAILSRLSCIVKLVMTVRRSMCSKTREREKKIGHQTRSPPPDAPSPQSNLVREGCEYCTLAAICAVHFQITFSFCGVEEYLQKKSKVLKQQRGSGGISSSNLVKSFTCLDSKSEKCLFPQKWLLALLCVIDEEGIKS